MFHKTNSDFSPLPNISIISSADIGSSSGLACGSALDTNQNIGEWFYPDGSPVRMITSGDPLYMLLRIGRVDLNRQGTVTSALEGIYTCRIPDQDNTVQSLHVGIYTAESYEGGKNHYDNALLASFPP